MPSGATFGLKIRQAQQGFFDRALVMNAMDQVTRRALSGFGAYVRTRARSSIRKRKKASVPGSPPSSHTGLLKKFIYFSFDQLSRSVVIGPALLNRSDGVPELLEYGGTSFLARHRGEQAGRDFRAQIHKRAWQYRARPFMTPAFNAEIAAGTVEKLFARASRAA